VYRPQGGRIDNRVGILTAGGRIDGCIGGRHIDSRWAYRRVYRGQAY